MNNTHKITLGLALIGATSLLVSAPASAAPKNRDVKEARKEVKQARKDVRRADSPEERRDAREDLRGEQRDYREERRENSPGYVRPSYSRPGYVRPEYVRPGSGYVRPGMGYGRVNGVSPDRSIQGIVTDDLKGNDFNVRVSSGQTVRVLAINGESGTISRGDTVRASGRYSGGTFNATNVTILRNR